MYLHPMTRAELAKKRRACADDVASGMVIGKVMEKYGWNQDAIRKACHGYGVSLRNNGVRGNIDRLFKVLAMIRAGGDPPEIAEELGITKAWVYKVRQQALDEGVLDKKEVEKNFKAADLKRAEAKWRRENPLRNG